MLNQFMAFIRERHNVYLRRAAGDLPPWTEDPMIREYKFTNIYRELDYTTIWCKNHVRDKSYLNEFDQALSILAFRFFNRVETGKAMFDSGAWTHYLHHGKIDIVKKCIQKQRGAGPVTTGAYIIKTVNGLNKLDGALWAIEAGRKTIQELVDVQPELLAQAHKILLKAPYLGSFMAAQLVADMKYTPLLEACHDWHTWAASGPGSLRGMNILIDRPVDTPWREADWLSEVLKLRLKITPMFLNLNWEIPHAQDVQNMLCEFSKYKRGYARNKFHARKHHEDLYTIPSPVISYKQKDTSTDTKEST